MKYIKNNHKLGAILAVMGIFAGAASMIGGYPPAIINIIEAGRFSMFLPAPLIAMGLFIALWFPGTKKLITDWES